MLDIWCVYLTQVHSQASHSCNQLVVEEVNEEVTGPVGELGGTRDHYLVLNISLSLFDNTLHDLISHHHVCHRKAHRSDHPLTCIDVRLDLKAEWQGLFMEIKFQVWVVSHVSHHGL